MRKRFIPQSFLCCLLRDKGIRKRSEENEKLINVHVFVQRESFNIYLAKLGHRINLCHV